MLLLAEKKLDCFVTSYLNNNTEKPTSHHRAVRSATNCCDIGMSPQRSAEDDTECRQSPCEFSENSVIFSDVCSTGDNSVASPNESQLTADRDSDAADSSSRDEIACIGEEERYPADIRREVDIRRVAELGVNTSIADTVYIDRNRNSLYPSDCKHDVNVDDNRNELIHSRDQIPDNRTSLLPSSDYVTMNRKLCSDPPSQERNRITGCLRDTAAVRTV